MCCFRTSCRSGMRSKRSFAERRPMRCRRLGSMRYAGWPRSCRAWGIWGTSRGCSCRRARTAIRTSIRATSIGGVMESLENTQDLMREAIVCDMTLPWIKGFIDEDTTLQRFHRAGIDFVSLADNPLAATIHHIAKVKAQILAHRGQMVFAATAEEITAAKATGRLAVGLH